MRPRFTILSLMELTAVIAFIIAADRAAFQLFSIRVIFEGSVAAINALAGAYVGIRLRAADTVESAINSARISSVCVSLVNTLVIAVIVAEGLRRSTSGEYFTWSRDWIQFSIVVAVVTLVSTGAGMLLSSLLAIVLKLGRKANA